jgi:hypothetical protein
MAAHGTLYVAQFSMTSSRKRFAAVISACRLPTDAPLPNMPWKLLQQLHELRFSATALELVQVGCFDAAAQSVRAK